jgi:hypothetical protein
MTSKSSTPEKYSHLAADPVRAVNEAMACQIAAMLAGREDDVMLQSLWLGIQ